MISVGSVIENCEIISVFDNKYCLAKCLGESPEEFVVWNIDNDLNGVHTGRYYNNRMDAEWCYAALCFDWFEDNVYINMVKEKELSLFESLNKKIEYAKTSSSPIELLYQAYGSIKMARNLEAISFDEYMTLNHLCVAEGINNPEYYYPKSQFKEVTPEQRIGYFTVWKNRSNIDFFKYVISVFDKISLSTEQEELLQTISENINYKYLDNISFLRKAYPIIFNIAT